MSVLPSSIVACQWQDFIQIYDDIACREKWHRAFSHYALSLILTFFFWLRNNFHILGWVMSTYHLWETIVIMKISLITNHMWQLINLECTKIWQYSMQFTQLTQKTKVHERNVMLCMVRSSFRVFKRNTKCTFICPTTGPCP